MKRLLVWVAAAVSAVSFVSCNPVTMVRSVGTARQAVGEFHGRLDRNEFAAIYADAHEDFKAASPEPKFYEFMESLRRKAGKIKGSSQQAFNTQSSLTRTTITLTYETNFEQVEAKEVFTFAVKDGKARLLGYDVRPREGKPK